MKNTKDALGFEILIGNAYGYMTETSGVVTIVVGTAIKVTDAGNITIKPVKKSSAYSTNIRDSISHDRLTSVKPIKLFPISINDLNKISQ